MAKDCCDNCKEGKECCSVHEGKFSSVATKQLVKKYKQMADERLSGSAALTFRLIAKELIKRKAKLESVNEAVEPKGNMAKIAKVVKDKQATKLSGVMIDMQSANLLMKLWDAVSDKDKEKMNKMNARLLTTVIKKLWSRINLKLPI
jgi:flagellar hook-basal body complex protein FliE